MAGNDLDAVSVFDPEPTGSSAPSVDRLIKGIEIDHNSEDALSAIVENGGVSIDVGNDWSGRHHGPHRPQGFQHYAVITLTLEEATRLFGWLSLAIGALAAASSPTERVELGERLNTEMSFDKSNSSEGSRTTEARTEAEEIKVRCGRNAVTFGSPSRQGAFAFDGSSWHRRTPYAGWERTADIPDDLFRSGHTPVIRVGRTTEEET